MKQQLKIVLILHLILGMLTSYPQQIKPSCELPEEPIVWSSDIFQGFDASRCDNDVEIIATSRDIKIKDYITVKEQRKLRFKPTGNYRIQILPNVAKKSRTSTGTASEGTEVKPPVMFTLAPNPTNSELQITSSEEIISYQVADFYGSILLEGTNFTNNTLSVNDLPPGTYFLLIQTEAGTAYKHFIKN